MLDVQLRNGDVVETVKMPRVRSGLRIKVMSPFKLNGDVFIPSGAVVFTDAVMSVATLSYDDRSLQHSKLLGVFVRGVLLE
jgi:hypothetical protein